MIKYLDPNMNDFDGLRRNLHDWSETMNLLEREKNFQYQEMRKACSIMYHKFNMNKAKSRLERHMSKQSMKSLTSNLTIEEGRQSSSNLLPEVETVGPDIALIEENNHQIARKNLLAEELKLAK